MICQGGDGRDDRSVIIANTKIIVSHLQIQIPTERLHAIDNRSKFLPDPGVSGVRSMGPGLCTSVQHLFENLTDVTLADDDTNSIPTDNANRAIQGNSNSP